MNLYIWIWFDRLEYPTIHTLIIIQVVIILYFQSCGTYNHLKTLSKLLFLNNKNKKKNQNLYELHKKIHKILILFKISKFVRKKYLLVFQESNLR